MKLKAEWECEKVRAERWREKKKTLAAGIEITTRLRGNLSASRPQLPMVRKVIHGRTAVCPHCGRVVGDCVLNGKGEPPEA